MAERPAFSELIEARSEISLLCVGLDADYEKLPAGVTVEDFLKEIVDATARHTLCYKPNFAFYADSTRGDEALDFIIGYIKDHYKGHAVIGDAKRGDIKNSNKGYAAEVFDRYQVDAVTVSPFLGADTYQPFLAYPGKGLIALCRTTNEGAHETQDVIVDLEKSVDNGSVTDEEKREIFDLIGRTAIEYYQLIAFRHGKLQRQNLNVGIVVGAKSPEAFVPVRMLYGEGLLLVPGVGVQGGDEEKAVIFGRNSQRSGLIMNASGSVMLASSGPDFARAAGEEAKRLQERFQEFRNAA